MGIHNMKFEISILPCWLIGYLRFSESSIWIYRRRAHHQRKPKKQSL